MKLWGNVSLNVRNSPLYFDYRESCDVCRGGGDFARLLVDLVFTAIAFSEHIGIPKAERDAALTSLRDQLTKFLTTE